MANAGLPAYPSNQAILQQAQGAANAAVPTKQSIMSQYGQSIADAGGFTRALDSLLKGVNIGGGYTPAIQQQAGVDQAAANRIAAVTGQAPTAAASSAAVGGLGASAMSHLISSQAAARAYGAQLPAIGAARGALAQQSLITSRNAALSQRGQEYASALQQALAQARQNALAVGSLHLNQAQLAFQENTQNQNNQYRYAALAQNQGQFKSSQARQWQEYLIGMKAKVSAGSAPGMQQYTPSEIQSLEKTGSNYAQSAILHGIPIQTAIRNMVAQNIPLQVATVQAQLEYANATRPTKDQFTLHAGTATATFNKNAYQAAMKTYNKVTGSLASWINLRKWQREMGGTQGYHGTYRPVRKKQP